jgi:asparagine synthase (glutamine-hydrolysing)
MDQGTIFAATNAGASTLLTGLGADELLDWHPFHLVDLISSGQLRKAWKVASQWAKADFISPWQVLEQFALDAALRNRLPAFIRWLVPSRTPIPLETPDRINIAPWIRSDFARRYDMQERALQHDRRRHQAFGSTRLSFVLDAISSRVGDVARWSLAAPRGLAIAHPFLDLRVICFGLGILEKIEPDPNQLKPLLAEATRGLLPESIRTRLRKGHFNEVFYLGLTRNLTFLEDLVLNPKNRDLDWLDAPILLRHLRQGALGGAGIRPLHSMNLTLCLLCWLAHQDRWFSSPSQVSYETIHIPYSPR